MAWGYLLMALAFAGLLVQLTGCESANSSSAVSAANTTSAPVNLLNVSYDPTREFYQEFNAAFSRHWLELHQQQVTIDQSHGGSGKQARSVIDGLEADVVTLALANDIDAIASIGNLISPQWQQRLPHRSCPYHSTIVFLVRGGNPKNIRDWNDLIRDDVEVVTPNPKVSGAARWAYLAAWGYSLQQQLGELPPWSDGSESNAVKQAQAGAREFLSRLFRRVPVLDSGARAATNTFAQRGIGDVLLAWENEAMLAMREQKSDSLEIVYPSLSIRADPPVAVVDTVVQKRGTQAVAQAYLEYLYSPVGQELAARHFYRPSQTEGMDTVLKQFPEIELFELEAVFGDWKRAQTTHFSDGGVFDQIYQASLSKTPSP